MDAVQQKILQSSESVIVADAVSALLPRRILLVEDDKAHAQLIGRALRGLAVQVSQVSTVAEAISVIESENIDMVLTDLNLVSCSGFDLLKAVGPKVAYLPVIVLTSSANLEDAVKSMREGAWDYLTKQFSSNFAGHLELVLSRNWQRALQRKQERKTEAERNAFWIASSLAEDGLAILGTDGCLLYHNASFEVLLGAMKQDSVSTGDDIVALVARHNFRLSQDLFSQIHINSDSLWRSELIVPRGESKQYFELRLSTILDNEVFITASELATQQQDLVGELDDGSESGIRYHILWVKDVTKIRESEQFERELLATTTHDLKGPLGAILTSSEIILDETAEELVKDLVLRVSSCARTCVTLVDELLSARKIQDGIMTIHPDWIDLGSPADDVFFDFETVAQSKSINFQLVKAEGAIPVFADCLALKRVLGNLVGNALKFTPRGGEVVIEVDRTSQGGMLRVSDNGSGIPADKQASLFEMFGRLSEHGQVDGTGLGLYIAKKLVDMHSGTLQVKSSIGIGTTFTVILDNPSK